ncbi:MAG: tyrosine-type recombinase/integrase [Pseudomonadota bacterium]
MELYKRPNSPYWWASFTVNGEKVRFSTKRKLNDKAGAKAVMSKEYQERLNSTQLGQKPEITLEEAFQITLDEVEGQTYRVYRTQRDKLLRFFPKGKRASSVSQADIEKLLAQRRKENVKGNTLRCEFKFLRRALNRVMLTHKVNTDLAWPTIKGFTKTRYLSEAEERAVLDHLKAGETITDAKAHDLAVFLLDTGMRLREAVELDWMDIDMTNRRINVFRPKTQTISTLPISNRVHDMLGRKTNQPAPFVKYEWAIKRLGEAINRECNTSQKVIEQRGKATIHTLRDTFASRLLQRGLSLQKVSKLLGHSTITQTAKYAHLSTSSVMEEAEQLLNGGPS